MYENIDDKWKYNFIKLSQERFESFNQPYDLMSLMQYNGNACLSDEAEAAGEKSTIVYKGTNVQ